MTTRNVFADATVMANKHGSVNLGQGFPSFPTDAFVKQAAIDAINANSNQYTRPGGSPLLIDVLSKAYTRILERTVDPYKNICVFGGAQQGIFVILSALCSAGDEVLLIEPCFPSYLKSARYLGLDVKSVALEMAGDGESANDFKIPFDEIRSKITEKTRIIICNSPHNPTGKVYTKDESEKLVSLLEENKNLIILTDEVYEFLVFDKLKHYPLLKMSSEKSANERIVSLSSAGKSFSCTGWRVGYSIASEDITAKLIEAQSIMSFCNSTPLEHAIAASVQESILNEAKSGNDNLLKVVTNQLEMNRNCLLDAFSSMPSFKVYKPHGGYFFAVDFTEFLKNPQMIKTLASEGNAQDPKDVLLNNWLTKEIGITGIPMSAFYSAQEKVDASCSIRYAFCKTEEELAEAAKKLLRLKEFV